MNPNYMCPNCDRPGVPIRNHPVFDRACPWCQDLDALTGVHDE